MNMGDILSMNARRTPGKIAISDERGSLTYSDMEIRTNSLANALLELGVMPKANIAILLGNRSEHIESILALAKIGIVSVPLDVKWKKNELMGALSFFDIKGIIAESWLAKELFQVSNELPDFNGPVVWVGDHPGAFSFRSFEYETIIAKATSAQPDILVDSEDIFIIMITSGTTGFPKGCLVSHQSYIYACLNYGIGRGVSSKDIQLAVLPICYNSGRVSVFGHLFFGATTIVRTKSDPDDVLATIEKEKVSYIALAPVQCDRLLQNSKVDYYDTSSIRCLRKAGSPLSRRTIEGLIEHVTPNIYQSYACTDTGTVSLLFPHEQLTRYGSSGRLIWAANVLIVNEQGVPLPQGEVGEIVCRGPLVCKGYYKNPQANATNFREGWLSTGDLGRFDEEGYLYVVGRKKNVIKSGSISIFPDEIQGVLQNHPSVFEVVVIGVPDAEWGEAVSAIVSLRPGEELSSEALIQYCKEQLAPYKAPKYVHFEKSLPHNESGKVAFEMVKAQLLKTLSEQHRKSKV